LIDCGEVAETAGDVLEVEQRHCGRSSCVRKKM
jgi:hypothetical protein